MYGVSVSPSLLARSWQWHAVASGVLTAAGYILGLTLQRLYAIVVPRLGVQITAPPTVALAFRVILFFGFFLWLIRWLVHSYRERRRADVLVGMSGENLGQYLLGTAGAFLLTLVLLAIASGLQWIGRALVAFFSQWLHYVVALSITCLLYTSPSPRD